MKSLTRAFPATERGGNHPGVTTLNGLNFSELEAPDAKRPEARVHCYALGAIFGVSDFLSPVQCWDWWVKGKKKEMEQSVAMKEEIIMEDAIWQLGQLHTGAVLVESLSPGWIFENQAVRLRGAPDRIAEIDGQLTVIEIKRSREEMSDISQVPNEYILQLNAYGLLTGIHNLEFWVESRGEFKRIAMNYHADLAEMTIAQVAAFLDGERPDPSGYADVGYELHQLCEEIKTETLIALMKSMPHLEALIETGDKDALNTLIEMVKLPDSENVMVNTREGKQGEVSLNQKDWGMLEGYEEIAHLPTVEKMEQIYSREQKNTSQHPTCALRGCLMNGSKK